MVVLNEPLEVLREKADDFRDAMKSLIVEQVAETEFSVENIEKGTKRKVVLMDVSNTPNVSVFDATCDCEDFVFRKGKQGKPCKHILAVLRDYFDGKVKIANIAKPSPGPKMETEKTLVSTEETKPVTKIAMSVESIMKPSSKIIGTSEPSQFVSAKELLASKDLVTISKEEEEEIVKRVDELDEKIILREYHVGQTPLIYRIFTGKDRYNIVLSIRGWTEAALLQKNIIVESVEYYTVKDKIIAIAWAKDVVRNFRTAGIAERTTSKEFELTTLGHKAIRNALKNLVSPEYEKKVIDMALSASAVIDLSGFDRFNRKLSEASDR